MHQNVTLKRCSATRTVKGACRMLPGGQLGNVDTTHTSPYVTVWPEKQKPHMSAPQWGPESHSK